MSSRRRRHSNGQPRALTVAGGSEPAELTVGGLRALSDVAQRSRLASSAGLSFGGNRDFYQALGYKRIISIDDYRTRFERNAIARRIVTALPDATWRGGAEIVEDEDPNADTEFEKAWNLLAGRTRVWSKLHRADVLAGLGRYAVLLIGAAGDLATELPRMNGPDGVAFLAPFSEYDVTVDSLVGDRTSQRFGLPELYKFKRLIGSSIRSTIVEEPVHWSRVIHIAEGLLSDEIFGPPRLECVWNLLDDLDKVTGGGSESFWLRAHQGFVASLDPDMKIGPEDIVALKEQVEEFAHQIRRSIAARGVKYEALGSDVAPIDKHVDALISQISAGCRTPKRILMGSERGELASSQDQENWDDQVSDRRDEFADPQCVRQLVDRLITYGALPTPVEYETRWPMRELNDKGRAEVADMWASINQKNGSIVVTVDEIRDRVLELPPLEELDDDSVDPNAEDVSVVKPGARTGDENQPAGAAKKKALHFTVPQTRASGGSRR